MSDSNFYRAFEDRHRGSRELILQRCENYKDYLTPLLALYQPARLQDLGCGRGEWLEYTRGLGFTVHGVDLDAGMLEACIERNLPVSQEDAITRLKSLPDNSQAVVSGFHIAEHIPFEVLQRLTQEALRVLQPGGLLILETPNPENLVVGTSSFYLDPTHQTPIPPLLLSFVAEYTGFCRIRIVRLQEDPALALQERPPGLMDVLGAVSPDYAIIAQKVAEPTVLQQFDELFAQELGLTLEALAQRYDKQHQERLDALAGRLNDVATEADARSREQAEYYESVMAEYQKQHQERLDALASRLNDVATEADARSREQAEHYESVMAEYQKQHQERLDALASRLNDVATEADTRLREQAEICDSAITELEGELKSLKEQAKQYEQMSNGLEREVQVLKTQAERPSSVTTGLEIEFKALREQLSSRESSQARLLEEQQKRLENVTGQLNESLANAHHWYLRATTAEQRVHDLHHSLSWRITAPLRGLGGLSTGLLRLPLKIAKPIALPFAMAAMKFVLKRPQMCGRWAKRLRQYPRLYAHMRQFALHRGLMREPKEPAIATTPEKEPANTELQALTPRAREIYQDLQDAIARTREQKECE